MAPKTGYQRKWPVGFRKWCAFKGLPVNSGTLQIYQGVLQAKQQQRLHGSPGFPGLSLPPSYTTPAKTAGGGGGGGAPRKRPRDPTDNPFNDPVPTNITFPPDQYPEMSRVPRIGYGNSAHKLSQASTSGAVARHVVKGKRARRVAFGNGHVVNLIRKIFMPNLNYLATSFGKICLGYTDYQFPQGDEQPVDGFIPKYDLNPILGQLCAPANDGSLRMVCQFVHNEYQDILNYSKNAQLMSPLASGVIPNRDTGNNVFDTALVYNGGTVSHRFHNDLNVVQHIKVYEVYARMVLPAGSTPLECWTRDLGRVALNNGSAVPTSDNPLAHSSVYNYYNYPTAKSNKELHRKFHVCKPHVVTLAPGQSLSYKLGLNGFKFDQAYFLQSLAIGSSNYNGIQSQPMILPGKTKFLIVISEGERMHLPFKAPSAILGPTVNPLAQPPSPAVPVYPGANNMTFNYTDTESGTVKLMGQYQAAGGTNNPDPLDVRLPTAAAPAGGAPYSSFTGMFVPGGDVNNAFITSTGASNLDPWTGLPTNGPLGIGRCYVQLSHIQVEKFSFSAIPIFKKFNRFIAGVSLDRLGGLPQEAVRTADVTVQNGINMLGEKMETS